MADMTAEEWDSHLAFFRDQAGLDITPDDCVGCTDCGAVYWASATGPDCPADRTPLTPLTIT